MQLDGLSARLSDAHSRYGPSDRPMPVCLALDLDGRVGSESVSITANTSASAEPLHLKMEWIRRSAPMSALRKAIDVLLEAFWAEKPGEVGEPTSQHVRRLLSNTYTHLRPDHFTGPSSLVFLETHYEAAPQLRWKFVPLDVQKDVGQYFLLFCFELFELGYRVLIEPFWPEYMIPDPGMVLKYSINIRG